MTEIGAGEVQIVARPRLALAALLELRHWVSNSGDPESKIHAGKQAFMRVVGELQGRLLRACQFRTPDNMVDCIVTNGTKGLQAPDLRAIPIRYSLG